MIMADNACKVHLTSSEEQTEELGTEISKVLQPGDVVALKGNLGSGKTCLVRGIVSGLGSDDLVNSPTFTIINQYHGRMPIFHFDVYRLNNEVEIEDLDIDDYLFNQGICLIEWAEKADRLLPPEYWNIDINIKGGNDREFVIKRINKGGEK